MGILMFLVVLIFVVLPSWISYGIVNRDQGGKELNLMGNCYNKDNGCLLCVPRTLVSYAE